jgi:hypothetical protein
MGYHYQMDQRIILAFNQIGFAAGGEDKASFGCSKLPGFRQS